MIIPKRVRRDIFAEYTNFAKKATSDIHALAGRDRHTNRTRAAISSILQHVDFNRNDRVLDIGCGDAGLLCEIPFVASAVGTVLTKEELEVLRSAPHLNGMKFHEASFNSLDKIPGKFDRIIVNGSLHFSRTSGGAHRALQNITALMAPSGKLWLGELLAKDCNRKEFNSKPKAVFHVFRHHGPRFGLAFLRHLFRHHVRAEKIISMAPPLWHIAPDQIPMLASAHGLKVEGIWNCREMTGDPFYALQDRFSVLLSKV